MNIKTKFHGEITVESNQIITFSKGVPGFEEQTQFVILPLAPNHPLHVLQSIKEAAIAFVIASPWTFQSDYEFDLPEDIKSTLKITSLEQVGVFNVLTLPKDLKQITINLLAPIVIQKETNQAIQMVLEQTNYTTKHVVSLVGC